MPKQESDTNSDDPQSQGLRRGARIATAVTLTLGLGGATAALAANQSRTPKANHADTPTLTETQAHRDENGSSANNEAHTPPTTAGEQSSEALGSVIQLDMLTHPTKGATFWVVNQGIHVLSNAPVVDRPATLADGAHLIQGGISGDITQAVAGTDESGNSFLCFFLQQPEVSSTGVACLNTSDSNTTKYLGVFNNGNINDMTPYDQAAITTSQVTVSEVNGIPYSQSPDSASSEVPIGGFNINPNTDQIPSK